MLRTKLILILVATFALFLPQLLLAQVCGGPFLYYEKLTGPTGSAGVTANDQEYVIRIAGGLVSSVRGVLVAASTGSPDMNSLGEVVYIQGVTDQQGQIVQQIFSTTRGQLTFVTVIQGATNPSINSLAEVVYQSLDANGFGQIFSTTRGQLTFINQFGFSSPERPEIDNTGRVVFKMTAPDDMPNCQPGGCPVSENIWEVDTDGNINQLTFYVSPDKAVQPTIAAVTGEVVYVQFNELTDILSLISDQDGILFTAPPDPGANFGVFPDLSPNGRLVFRGLDQGIFPFHAWVGIRDDNGQECTFTGVTCNTPLAQCETDLTICDTNLTTCEDALAICLGIDDCVNEDGAAKGDACNSDNNCCSNKCKGPSGRKTCK